MGIQNTPGLTRRLFEPSIVSKEVNRPRPPRRSPRGIGPGQGEDDQVSVVVDRGGEGREVAGGGAFGDVGGNGVDRRAERIHRGPGMRVELLVIQMRAGLHSRVSRDAERSAVCFVTAGALVHDLTETASIPTTFVPAHRTAF